MFTKSQLEGWKRVTDAVHAKGGYIYCQLWHTGRASGPGLRNGQQPISSSELPMSGNYLSGEVCSEHPPRAMTTTEIQETTKTWGKAAKDAIETAGFDGVEIHGGMFHSLTVLS